MVNSFTGSGRSEKNSQSPYSLQETRDQIHSKIVLSELIGKDVSLQRKGQTFWGLCPFHHEKTPSFSVSDLKNFYHCFGCGAHGDAITYIIERLNMPFIDAVEYLANLYGIPFSKKAFSPISEEEQKKKRSIAHVLTRAATVYHEILLKDPSAQTARQYLQQRNISLTSIKEFQLGFCNGQSLALFKKEGITDDLLKDAGLLSESMKKERFAGRIIFPICDLKGQIIAFGGRSLSPEKKTDQKKDKTSPKYLNSAESDFFQKRQTLFNLNTAVTHSKEKNLIVVEGYIDVISMVQNGFPQTVATLGTALSEQHIQKLWRYSSHPILCFDGDEAGIKAAARSALRALPILETGKTLFFCCLPDNMDPDEILKTHGSDFMQQKLDQSVHLSKVLWQELLSHYHPSSQNGMNPLLIPEDQAALKKDIGHVLDLIPSSDIRKSYADILYSLYFSLLRDSKQKSRSFFTPQQSNAGQQKKISADFFGKSGKSKFKEKIILGILLEDPIILPEIDEYLLQTEFEDPLLRKIKDWLLDIYFQQKDFEEEECKHMRLNFLQQLGGKDLLKIHVPFLLQEEISQTKVIARWKEICLSIDNDKTNPFRRIKLIDRKIKPEQKLNEKKKDSKGP